MKLSEMMHRDVQVIAGDTTVREAARRMSKLDVGALPVCDDDRIVGILTDRDLIVRSIARGDDPEKARVSDVMTREVECSFEDDSVDEASQKMCTRQIQRLIVLDRTNKLVGIVSIADLVRARTDAPALSHVVEEIKAPTKASGAGAGAQQVGR